MSVTYQTQSDRARGRSLWPSPARGKLNAERVDAVSETRITYVPARGGGDLSMNEQALLGQTSLRPGT